MKPKTASASEPWISRRINRSVMIGSCADVAIFADIKQRFLFPERNQLVSEKIKKRCLFD
jgi:hypothetical protein